MANKARPRTYLVAVHNMDDGKTERLYKVKGSRPQIKRHLARLVKADMMKNKEEWVDGTLKYTDVSEYVDGKLFAYGNYSYSYISYDAWPEEEPIEL